MNIVLQIHTGFYRKICIVCTNTSVYPCLSISSLIDCFYSKAYSLVDSCLKYLSVESYHDPARNTGTMGIQQRLADQVRRGRRYKRLVSGSLPSLVTLPVKRKMRLYSADLPSSSRLDFALETLLHVALTQHKLSFALPTRSWDHQCLDEPYLHSRKQIRTFIIICFVNTIIN